MLLELVFEYGIFLPRNGFSMLKLLKIHAFLTERRTFKLLCIKLPHVYRYLILNTTAAAKSLQSCLNVQQLTRLSRPWDSPGKNTRVGCHFLLQCMKVKSESEVAQLCPTLIDPMDCSLPGSSIHGIFQARVLEWGAIAFSVEHYWSSPIYLLQIYIKITLTFNVPLH